MFTFPDFPFLYNYSMERKQTIFNLLDFHLPNIVLGEASNLEHFIINLCNDEDAFLLATKYTDVLPEIY